MCCNTTSCVTPSVKIKNGTCVIVVLFVVMLLHDFDLLVLTRSGLEGVQIDRVVSRLGAPPYRGAPRNKEHDIGNFY